MTVCHSRTQNLAHHTTQADILVAAIGRAHFVTEEMVKEGAVVIDVGIIRIVDETKASGHRLTGMSILKPWPLGAAGLRPSPEVWAP